MHDYTMSPPARSTAPIKPTALALDEPIAVGRDELERLCNTRGVSGAHREAVLAGTSCLRMSSRETYQLAGAVGRSTSTKSVEWAEVEAQAKPLLATFVTPEVAALVAKRTGMRPSNPSDHPGIIPPAKTATKADGDAVATRVEELLFGGDHSYRRKHQP